MQNWRQWECHPKITLLEGRLRELKWQPMKLLVPQVIGYRHSILTNLLGDGTFQETNAKVTINVALLASVTRRMTKMGFELCKVRMTGPMQLG